jgi:hypothetical protein
VVRAGRLSDYVSLSHEVLRTLVEDELGLPLFNAEELVDVLVHLGTDLFPRFQAHHHELGVLSSE